MIAVIADTHMPRGARRVPQRCIELIGAADVIHAGDFFGIAALEKIESRCPVVHAVHGNVDEPALRRSKWSSAARSSRSSTTLGKGNAAAAAPALSSSRGRGLRL